MTKQLATAAWPFGLTLADYRERINEALVKFFEQTPYMLALDVSPVAQDALEKLREYTLRPGKRIRGSLAAAAYDSVAKTIYGESGIMLGVALELMQSYLLIVDDVMDESALRRGQPTIHRLYAAAADIYSNPNETNMLAINVGLIGQHLANLALVDAPESSEWIVATLRSVHHNITATGFGQLDDLYQRAGRKVTQPDIIRKYRYKSSYYTFINPLEAGLVLGGMAGEVAHREAVAFGEAAGIAFQLHDDLLGIFGDTSVMGKSNIDDIQEGAYTLLVYYALQHATPRDVAELRAALGNQHLKSSDMLRIQEIFEVSGASAFVRAEVVRYGDIARQALAASTIWDESFKARLTELLDYVITRQS